MSKGSAVNLNQDKNGSDLQKLYTDPIYHPTDVVNSQVNLRDKHSLRLNLPPRSN